MKYWVVTDTHYGHDKLTKLCGRPKDFSERIHKSLFKTIKYDDVLIHLGDVCWGNDAIWHTAYIAPLTCTKVLVRGNHDKMSNPWYLDHGWSFVCDSFTLDLFGTSILFSHKPAIDSGYGLNLFGHFHSNDHHSYEPELVATFNKKQVLLAMEFNHYQPFSLNSVVDTALKNIKNKHFVDGRLPHA